MTPAPKRRWSYSLRTLFVAVTLFACLLGYEWSWIHQRRAVIGDPQVRSSNYYNSVSVLANTGQILTRREYVSAPWQIRWMGEPGYAHVLLGKGATDEEAARVTRLFPEAEGVAVDER